jgi:hypothetical protein
MNATPIASTNSARWRRPAEMMSQTDVTAGLTASEAATESTPLPIKRRMTRMNSVVTTIPPPAAIKTSRRHPLAR